MTEKKTSSNKTSSSKKGVREYQRPRGGPARAIADLVPAIGRTAFRRFGFVQSSVVTRWAEIVGETHARISAPESIRFPYGERTGGTMQLVVASGYAPLIQQIIPEIIERVNRFFGYAAVSAIKIRQGEVQRHTATPTIIPPTLKPIPLELGESLRDIGDPELAEVLGALARGLYADKDGD